MRGEGALLTVAEFGIALAGFTSVVVVFGMRDGGWAPIDRFRVQQALLGSLGAGFFALVPSALDLLGMSGEALWRLASALLLAYLGTLMSLGFSGLRRLSPEERAFLGAVQLIMPVAGAIAMLVMAANTFGLPAEPQPGVYFLGLLFLLGVAVVGFTRTVFMRPRSK